MINNRSLKLETWTRKDIAFNVVTYLVNTLILVGLFLAKIAIESAEKGIAFSQFFSNLSSFANFLILLLLIIATMLVYFLFEYRNFLRSAVNSEMIFLILEIALIINFSIGHYVNIYLRPLAFTALLVLFLTNSRTSVFVNIIFCLMLFLFDSITVGVSDLSNSVYFLVMGISSGVIATYCMRNVYSRLRLLCVSLVCSVPIVLCTLIPLTQFGGSDNILVSLICGACSGPSSAIVFMVLLPIFEALFKKVSCFKYSEFTDHRSRFIKKLIAEAPGTFNHSIIVSNIAEACATAIGEDALLARTCAYYHDIGKLRRAEFFKENQSNDDNPHNDLMPELSANIIKSHTSDGYQLVMKNRLPKEIAEVCRQHHGTMPILYFYDKAKKFTDGEVDIRQYCYAGPKPQTKIAAIIMIADSCEAATRTLKDRSNDKVTKVVRKIVSDRMQLNQFDECEITLKELNIIIHTVINNLTGVYHSRIEYPKVSLDGVQIDDVKKD